MKFQTTEFFTPTRDFNADDVIFSFERQLKADNPWNKYVDGRFLGIFRRHGLARTDRVDREGRRPDGQVHAQPQPEAPFLANLAMDFASIVSKEYADKLAG